MKQSLFLAELKEIVKSRKLFVPLLAVMFIPVLYAGMFLWAFWDPYAHLKDLPVAVVNKDAGANFEGEDLKLGKELEKEIRKSDDFDFHIVSDKEAERGLEQQNYYMVVEIPADFSENATTLLDESPEKLKLKYIPNESYNFLSAQIGETAVKEIRTSLQKTITKTYSETMFEKIKEMGDGFAKASDGAGELDEGAIKLSDGAAKIKENLATLAGKSIEFSEGISKAGDGSKQLAEGAGKLHAGLGQLEEGQNRLLAGGKEVQTGTDQLAGGITKLQQGLHTVDSKMGELTKGTAEAKAGIAQFQEKVPQLAKGTSELAAGSEQLNAGISQFETQLIEQVNGSMDKQMAQLLPILEQSMTPEQLAGFKQQMAAQKQQMVQGIEGGFGSLKAGSQKVAAGSKEVNSAVSGQLAPNLEKLNGGLGKIQTGQEQLNQGVSELAKGSDQLAQGAGQLQSGEKELVNGMATLAGKLGEAKAGSAELANGASELSGGMSQLDSGSKKLSDGAGKLADGSSELADGTVKLESGTKELHEKLQEAAEKSNSVKATDKNYDMMAEPVKVAKETRQHVPNYGTGFAPYFLSLGLFVGALLLSIVFPLREPAVRPKNGFSWFIGKFGVLFFAGIIQSLLAAAVLLYGLKIEVQSIPLFLATTIITSLTFIALVQMLVTILGDPGRFVAILILIFQLTTSAGTFPLELIPEALQPFSALLPMTYSVNALKAVISSGDFSFMWTNNGILGLFAAGCLVLTVIFFRGLYKRQFAHQPSDHEAAVSIN
ncbi:putative membrane protein [Bacillus ectoiniformans]|uniref:YhgE/Pip domain-containing protein n=1 Tax=Bacillus ectoiniformans TaxID=1494429 RepID=UPI0019599B5B|nr:YhgE/Pip domain-containing protein [Bacillus ectoiniformans]MBM7647599.1 putative membrane protein [Bacillus ectoiniformans]